MLPTGESVALSGGLVDRASPAAHPTPTAGMLDVARWNKRTAPCCPVGPDVLGAARQWAPSSRGRAWDERDYLSWLP